MKPVLFKLFSGLLILTALFSAFPAQAVLAASGTLDAGFNYGPGNGADGAVYALARQPDGKILIGGSFTAYNGDVNAPDKLLRLNVDGTLDNTFNYGSGGANGDVLAIALQPDGSILIGGDFTGYNGDLSVPDYLLRLNPDGSLDTTFSEAVSGPNNTVTSLALQSDNAILVGGYFTAYNGVTQAPDRILRLTSTGALDTGFNYGSGTLGANFTVNAILVQPDGQIVIGGSFNSYNGSANIRHHLARLNGSDGSLDATFISSGTEASADVRAIVRQPVDGKLIIGGYFTSFNGDANAPDNLLRVNVDGSLDTTFNPAGSGPFVSGYHAVNSLALQPDGKLLVGGYFDQYDGVTTAPDHILRVNADGSLDTTFNNGAATGLDGEVFALALQPDTAILVGGLFSTYNADVNASDNILRIGELGPSPTVTSISPTAGPTSGGTSVTFLGSNLGAASFTFGGLPGSGCVISVDGSSATCITPAHAAGSVTVTVTTLSGSVVMPGAFTYVPASLAITGSGPATVKPGDEYTYTFSYQTTTAVTNAVAHLTLPSHAIFIGASKVCLVAPGVVDCSLGDLPAAGQSSFTVKVLVEKLKKVGTSFALDAGAYSISATGGTSANGTVTVVANTLTPFQDVPAGNVFLDYIQSIWAYGITSGCMTTSLSYCPGQYVTRGQMAVFIERGVHGSSFDPGNPALTFSDTANSQFKYYIEALAKDGITIGCGAAKFCPEANVTRAQMAIFLLRGKFGGGYVPPAATGLVFQDVPANAFAAAFIEKLYALEITRGCKIGSYCPNDSVTRDTMAAFLQRNFGLSLPTP